MTPKNIIKTKKISEQVAEMLEERILSGVYRVGTRLPAERKLVVELGVSRPSIRDALQVLVARGMIEVRQGDGYYVSAALQNDFISSWQDLIERHEYLSADVLDFRRALEGTIAALAAQRRTDTDLERLSFWLEKLEDAYQNRQISAQSEADVRFHQAVAEASHNILFAQMAASLLRMLNQHTRDNLANMFGVAKQPELIAQHRAIFDAIKKQQPMKADKLARAHLDYVESCLHTAHAQAQRQAHSQALARADGVEAGKNEYR